MNVQRIFTGLTDFYLIVHLEGREVPNERFLIRIYLFLAEENFRKVVLSRGTEFSSYLEVAEMANKLFRVNFFEELYHVEEIELFDRVDTFKIFNTDITVSYTHLTLPTIYSV